jgi:hypothetical protein
MGGHVIASDAKGNDMELVQTGMGLAEEEGGDVQDWVE